MHPWSYVTTDQLQVGQWQRATSQGGTPLQPGQCMQLPPGQASAKGVLPA